MKVIEFDYKNIPSINDSFSLCLGYFDGVHIGHQSMIKKSINEGYKTAVITFDHSPKYVLGISKQEYQLTDIKQKTKIFKELGVSYLFILHFDKECASMDYVSFANLIKKLNPSILYCGSDYTFGKGGLGNPTYLKTMFEVNVVPFEIVDEEKISSRNIVKLIENGQVDVANKLMGRNYTLKGKVIKGFQNGKTIGFPTANINIKDHVRPFKGVYAAYTYIDNHKYLSMVNVGTHPTIDENNEIILESNIFDFSENIYGKTIRIELVKHTRDEKKFPSLEELKKQLQNDEKEIRQLLK